MSKNQYHNIERPTIATGLQDAKFFRELLEPLNNGIQDTSINFKVDYNKIQHRDDSENVYAL